MRVGLSLDTADCDRVVLLLYAIQVVLCLLHSLEALLGLHEWPPG